MADPAKYIPTLSLWVAANVSIKILSTEFFNFLQSFVLTRFTSEERHQPAIRLPCLVHLLGKTHNNLFVNARSGGTGVHYAMCVANQLPGAPGPGFSNCNNFYVSGTGGVIGGSYYFGFTSYTTLVDFQTASGQEYNSLNLNPMFVNGSGSYTAAEDF